MLDFFIHSCYALDDSTIIGSFNFLQIYFLPIMRDYATGLIAYVARPFSLIIILILVILLFIRLLKKFLWI